MTEEEAHSTIKAFERVQYAKLHLMKQFILTATFEKTENIEDAQLAEKAKETLKRLESEEKKPFLGKQ